MIGKGSAKVGPFSIRNEGTKTQEISSSKK